MDQAFSWDFAYVLDGVPWRVSLVGVADGGLVAAGGASGSREGEPVKCLSEKPLAWRHLLFWCCGQGVEAFLLGL